MRGDGMPTGRHVATRELVSASAHYTADMVAEEYNLPIEEAERLIERFTPELERAMAAAADKAMGFAIDLTLMGKRQ